MERRRSNLRPNDLLRTARLRLPSPSGSGRSMSRQELADAINSYLWHTYQEKQDLTENDIGKLERGVTRWPGKRRREAFRVILRAATDDELGFYIVRGLNSSRPSPTVSGHQVPGCPAVAVLGEANGRVAPVAPEPVSAPLVVGNDCHSLDGHSHVAAMKSFRAADRQVGGGHLYATVVKYLHTELGPQLIGAESGEDDGRLAFTAAAALTEMAGWMAHDAGRDQAAWRHFARSHDLIEIGGDRQLGAHILASMSHLAHHVGKPADAIALAQRGRERVSGGPAQPELEARLLAMKARGFAALRRTDECTKLLHEAERVLTLPHAERLSPWVSRFDEGSLASEAARCLRQLGDLNEARRQAERIISLRPASRTRSRAFGQLILVTVLIAQGKADQACAVAWEILDATQQLGSYLVVQQLLELKQLLGPYRGSDAVTAFLLGLDETLRERLWLYQWLAKDSQAGRHREGA